MGTAFLILLLLALCGFIAYIGDLLGRRFGKKRLTLFGMRPKHTAIILTIATGVVIAGFTFLVALLIVPGFRQAVTQGEKLVGQNSRLRQANAHQASENARLEQANGALSATNAGLQKTNAELSGTNGTLKRTNETLTKQSAELRGKNGELTRANAELAGHNTELRGTNSRLEADNSRLQSEQQKLASTVKLLDGQINTLRNLASSHQRGLYIYRKEQDLWDRLPVLPGTPPSIMARSVNTFVYGIVQRVQQVGARAGDGKPALYLVPPKNYPAGLSRTNTAIRNWLVSQAQREESKPLFWRLVADENCIKGRPVPARLEWYTNDLVFRSGQLVRSPGSGFWWPVDGSKVTEGAVLKQLVYFLRVSVAEAARQQRIVPDTDGAVGSDQGLDWEQIVKAAHKVLEINGDAVVVARARQETRRSGPLYVDLEAYPATNEGMMPDDVRQAIKEVERAGAGR